MEKGVAGAEADVAKLERMLSVRSGYVGEELCLLITLRVTLELVLDLLPCTAAHRNLMARLGHLDRELIDVALSSRYRRAFQQEQRSTRRNWGIPLSSRWLHADLSLPGEPR
ncbi:MAG: hypothetical protein AAGF12_28230 [Myxococcota bacterium]